MANGQEDLAEKNKDRQMPSLKWTEWKNFQGREDADMLEEKQTGWSSKKSSRGDYDSYYDD